MYIYSVSIVQITRGVDANVAKTGTPKEFMKEVVAKETELMEEAITPDILRLE